MWSRVGKSTSLLKGLDAVPITAHEFYSSHVQAVWKHNAGTHSASAGPPKIGLCVSGGADSMCLTYLFIQLQKQKLLPPVDLKAFIVDHKARHESTAEARSVERLLCQIGVKSEILTIKWPENVLPASLPNFETQARLKRYHLLAQAAVRSGIRHLFLGHHQDDQIETILMRLVRGKSGSLASFRGIAPRAPIPVSPEMESGLMGFQNPASEEEHFLWNVETPKQHEPVERGGPGLTHQDSLNSLNGRISLPPRLDVTLHRPLLKFPKARILATCEANSISSVLDRSNFDPQTTLRNALRHLRSNFRLPRALCGDSILKVHDRALLRKSRVEMEALRLFDVAHITSLDLRSGSLKVSLPNLPGLLDWEYSETPVSFLARVLRLVSPLNEYELSKSSQQFSANLIFPKAFSTLHNRGASVPVTSLVVNQVLMTPEIPKNSSDQPYYTTWRLSRQPFTRKQMKSVSRMFVHQSTPEHDARRAFPSEWIFWDCRYWIRIWCASINYLQTCTLRPFRPSDAADINTNLDRRTRETLTNLLHDAAPGKIRYTIPVIADDTGVRVFPTLDFAVPSHESDNMADMKSKPGLLSWKVKYKYIDHKAMERLMLQKFHEISLGQPRKSPWTTSHDILASIGPSYK